MIQIPKRPTRRPPRTEETQVVDLARHQRLAEVESHRNVRIVAERASDRFDKLSFKSTGSGVEVKVSNTLGFTPKIGWVCERHGNYNVWWSRDDLADDEFIYLKTNAPKGERFTMRFE